MTDDPWVTALEKFEPKAREILGAGPDDDPMDLAEGLERENERIIAADAQLSAAKFTVTSENGLISVTMTGDGSITALTLDDDVYRRYLPRELGPAVLETVNAAMAEQAEQFRTAYSDVFTDEAILDDIVAKWPGRRPADRDTTVDAEDAGWS